MHATNGRTVSHYEVKSAGGSLDQVLEIKELIEQQGSSFEEFKARYDEKLKAVEDFMAKSNRPGARQERTTEGYSNEERKHLETAFRALVAGDQRTVDAELKSMSAGTDPSGGYTVHAQWESELVRLQTEISPFLSMVKTIPLTTGDALEGLEDLLPAEALWVGEEESRAETTTPDLGLGRIELKEIYAQPAVSQKLLDVSSIDVIAWLNGKIAEAFASKTTIATMTGDGLKQPRGLTTYTTAATGDSTRSWGVLEHIVSGANGAFAGSNPADILFDIEAALRPRYRARASWIMPRAVAKLVRKFKDSTGQYLWQPSMQAGQPSMLIGYPVTIVEEMPTLTTNSLSMGLGDWRETYTVIRRPGVKLLTDPYTAKPKVKQYAYQRVGGAVTNFEAAKLVKFST